MSSLSAAGASTEIIDRKVTPGSLVEALQPLVSVADLSSLWVFLKAYEKDLPLLERGLTVTIRADGSPGRSWLGRVEEIPDSVTLRRIRPQDPSRPTDARVLAVKVAFAVPSPLKLATTVDLRIAPRRR